MKIDNIIEAENEAKRFLSRLRNLKNSERNSKNFTSLGDERTNACKEVSAVKRSSLDLSRALAKMRQDIW